MADNTGIVWDDEKPDLASQSRLIDKMQADNPQPSGFMGAVGEDAGGMAKSLIPGYGAFENAKAAYQSRQPVSISQNDAARKSEGRSLPYRVAAGVGENLGINARGMEEAANRGDTGGVIGHTVVPAATALAPLALEAPKPIARGVGGAIEGTSRWATKPMIQEGSLRGLPISPATIGGGVAGAALGEHVAPGFEGALIGGAGGAAAANALAKSGERLGSRIRQWGGYEPPPVSAIDQMRAAGQPIPQVPPLKTSIIPTPEEGAEEPLVRLTDAPTPRRGGTHSVIKPTDPSYGRMSRGSEASRTNDDVQALAGPLKQHGDVSVYREGQERGILGEGRLVDKLRRKGVVK